MEPDLNLIGTPVQPWHTHNRTHSRGYAFCGGRLYEGGELARLADEWPENAWPDHLIRLNGSFALIKICSGTGGPGLMVASDPVRSIPVFYANGPDGPLVSDRAEWIRDRLELQRVDHLLGAEFLLTGYVTGNDTLFPELKQTAAGELLSVWNNGSSTRQSWYRFCEPDTPSRDDLSMDHAVEQLDHIHCHVFERLVESLDGRPAVIPLSGGYDSRLIAVMLKRLGYDRITCVSYGPPRHWEVRQARELAEHLELPFIHIPYTRDSWQDWFLSPHRRNFTLRDNGYASHAHLLEFPGTGELQRGRHIPEDSVFIPGHSGGFLNGNHVPGQLANRSRTTTWELMDALYRKNYTLWKWRTAGADRQNSHGELQYALDCRLLQQLVPEAALQAPDDAVADTTGARQACEQLFRRELTGARACRLFRIWEWKERQTKYVVNAIRAYDFWGYEWRLPLWDRELADFWARMPLEWLAGRHLHHRYIARKQNLPLSAPNASRLAKINERYNPLARPQFGRFFGSHMRFRIFTSRNRDLLPALPYAFIRPHRPVFLEKPVALTNARYLGEILSDTRSSIL